MHAALRVIFRLARWCIGAAVAAAIAWLAIAGARADEPIQVDALLLTGLDVSQSLSPEDIRLEVEGIALAIQSPSVLAAIQRGEHGRIGFAVYLWAEGRDMPLVAPWRVIATADDAAIVAAELLAATTDLAAVQRRAGQLTNLADSLLNAAALLQAAPFQAQRLVVNIVTDGAPTMKEFAVPAARAALLATGATINGMIVSGTDETAEYFRVGVAGGRGAFVYTVSQAESLVYAFRRKFVLDMAMME